MDPSHGEIIKFILWAMGTGITIASLFLTIWWKVESRQDKKIDTLQETNNQAHKHIYTKMDGLRDKVEDIWKHLVHDGNNNKHRRR